MTEDGEVTQLSKPQAEQTKAVPVAQGSLSEKKAMYESGPLGGFESGVPVFFREWYGAYVERASPLMMQDAALIMGMGMFVEHTYPAEEPMVAR